MTSDLTFSVIKLRLLTMSNAVVPASEINLVTTHETSFVVNFLETAVLITRKAFSDF